MRTLTIRKPEPRSTWEFRPTTLRNHLPPRKLAHPEIAAKFWDRQVCTAPWFDPEREIVLVLSLDNLYRIISYSLVAMGSVNEVHVHLRDVFRPAIAQNAAAVLLMHNHPTGDPLPSSHDGNLTRRVHEAGLLLGVALVDHVIVGNNSRYFSFLGARALASGIVRKSRRKRSCY